MMLYLKKVKVNITPRDINHPQLLIYKKTKTFIARSVFISLQLLYFLIPQANRPKTDNKTEKTDVNRDWHYSFDEDSTSEANNYQVRTRNAIILLNIEYTTTIIPTD